MMTQTSPVITTQSNSAPYSVRVLESKPLTPTMHMIRLEKPTTFDFRVSQAVRLFLNTANGIERHPLSIASSPTRVYLEFAARQTHSDWKKGFFALKKGDEINIEGPLGRFFLNEQHPAILIAGGIGITPLKSMVEYATDVRLRTNMTLLYSNRTADEIAFKDELGALALSNPHLKIIHTITRHQPHHEWNGRIGRIDAELLRQVSHDKPNALYYICGTPSMIADTVQMLTTMGVSSERIQLETFKGYARHADSF
jgi:ferredoxin-NADP reductase